MSFPRFESLIEAHHDEIHRYIWRGLWSGGNTHPGDDAEDLTQETFLKAFDAYPGLQSASNLRAWLYKIASNCLNSYWRQSVPPALALEPELVSAADAEQRPVEVEAGTDRARALQRGLRRLPEKQRHAVILRYLDELEYDAIALILDCSYDSARANVSHGLRQLRDLMPSAAYLPREEPR